jgi:MFS family permease
VASATPEVSRRRVVWSLNIVSFSWSIGLGAAVPVIPILAFQLQDNVALAGVVVTMGGAGRLLVSYVTGPLVDRFGRRGIAIVGVTIRMIFSFLEGLSPTYLSLVFFRFMSGVGTATWGTGLQTITADISKRSDRGSITGSRQGFQHLGMIIGPFVGTAAWAVTGDIRVPFFINGFSKMICLLVFLFVMVETRSLSQEEGEGKASPPKPAVAAPAVATAAGVATARRHGHWPAFIASGFMFVAIGLFATGLFRAAIADTMLSLYVRNILELPQSALGLAISGIGFGGLVASVAGGRIADRMGVGIIIAPGALIVAGALLLLTFDPGTVALVSIGVMLGAGASLVQVGTNVFAIDISPRGSRGRFFGKVQASMHAASFVGPAAVGGIADFAGFNSAFVALAVFFSFVSFVGIAMARYRVAPDLRDAP